MEKIFSAYADRKGVSLSALRFALDGARINPDQTPKMVSENLKQNLMNLKF